MFSRILAGCLVATGASGQTATLTETPATPLELGRVSVGAGGGQRGAGTVAVEAGAEVRLMDRLSARGGVTWEDEAASPFAGARLQLLSQEEVGFDLTTSATLRGRGMEGEGSELELRAVGAKRWGSWTGLATGMVGKGLGLRGDVDFEAGAAALRELAGPVSVGLEARVRGELVDEFKTDEDFGRPVELIAGPTVTLRHQSLSATLLGGYRAPRGPGPAGLAAFAIIGFDL